MFNEKKELLVFVMQKLGKNETFILWFMSGMHNLFEVEDQKRNRMMSRAKSAREH